MGMGVVCHTLSEVWIHKFLHRIPHPSLSETWLCLSKIITAGRTKQSKRGVCTHTHLCVQQEVHQHCTHLYCLHCVCSGLHQSSWSGRGMGYALVVWSALTFSWFTWTHIHCLVPYRCGGIHSPEKEPSFFTLATREVVQMVSYTREADLKSHPIRLSVTSLYADNTLRQYSLLEKVGP